MSTFLPLEALYSTTPHLAISTSALGLSIGPVSEFSIFDTTSAPSSTRPKITCFPSSQGVGTVVMKNCEPEKKEKGGNCFCFVDVLIVRERKV